VIQLIYAEKRARLIFSCFVFNKSLRNTDVLEYLFVNYIFISGNSTNSAISFNCRPKRNLFCMPHFNLILFQRLCFIAYTSIHTSNTSSDIFDKLRETYFRLGHTKKKQCYYGAETLLLWCRNIVIMVQKQCYYGAEIRIEMNFAKSEFLRPNWFRECCKLRHYPWCGDVRVPKDSPIWILSIHILINTI
jgi:hypothetical protein